MLTGEIGVSQGRIDVDRNRMLTMIFCLLLLFNITFGGALYIPAKVCLTWKIKNDLLVLGCKTDNFDYSITFFDPVGNEKAVCLPQTCHSYINATIFQNITTNETFLSIPLEADAEKFNGWWNCRYGNRNGKAMVEITLSKFSFDEKKDMPSSSLILIIPCIILPTVLFCVLVCIVCYCLLRNREKSACNFKKETTQEEVDTPRAAADTSQEEEDTPGAAADNLPDDDNKETNNLLDDDNKETGSSDYAIKNKKGSPLIDHTNQAKGRGKHSSTATTSF